MTPGYYTITGAQDWPILLVVGGILIGAIGLMWADLKNAMKDNKTEVKKEIDDIWAEISRCQEKCWDVGGRRKGDHNDEHDKH